MRSWLDEVTLVQWLGQAAIFPKNVTVKSLDTRHRAIATTSCNAHAWCMIRGGAHDTSGIEDERPLTSNLCSELTDRSWPERDIPFEVCTRQNN